uniref:Uncharacterized protein n=1 Tax=Panagrolaimus sp. PS1159 TaxID=55785 RepID=A0AC35FI20_9BILA
MATKSDKYSFIKQSFTASENRDYNLNLNQSEKCPVLIPVQSYSKPNNEKEKLQSWKKSSKISTFTTLDEDNDDFKKRWKNEKFLKTTNKSTLSLHIAAYENTNKAFTQSFADACKSQNPFEFPRQQNGGNKPEVAQFKPSQQLIGAAAAATPALTDNKAGTTTAEKTEDQKFDIVSEPQPADENVALPNPATQSTYQRVEKGTRTALLYWDGWLSAQDARLHEEDPSYFGRSSQAPPDSTTTSTTSSTSNSAALPLKQPIKRNTNLKKNWTYGKNGEVVYIATGFVGMFDKQPAGTASAYSAVGGAATAAGGGSNTGSSYGALNLSNYGGKPSPLPKHSGPSVGTTWDLK